MNPRLLFCSLVAVLLPCGLLSAHRDVRIELHGTKLVGLPDEYSPAELDLKTFRLRIKNHVMEFSPLLKSFFDEPYDLEVSSSWYHDLDVLPPYLSLEIRPKKKDFRFQILLALKTLHVLEVSVVLQETKTTTQELPIALSEDQKKQIRESVKTVR